MTVKELKRILDTHDDELVLTITTLGEKGGRRKSHMLFLRKPNDWYNEFGRELIAVVGDACLPVEAAGSPAERRALADIARELTLLREDIAHTIDNGLDVMKDAVRVYARELARIAITPGDQEAIDEINQHLLDEGLEVFNLT